ncbi:MAG: hypothetical protein IAF58_07015, partial [Leptolyngbya sp.]|nr:hypothetical protein [Candidatus Melainabacteria bacterium]
DDREKVLSIYFPASKSDAEKLTTDLLRDRGIKFSATDALQLPSASSNMPHDVRFPVDMIYEGINLNQELSLDSRPSFSKADYLDFCEPFTLSVDGDSRERNFAELELTKQFSAYEKLWKRSILPLTHRIDFAPFRGANTNLRTSVNQEVLFMAQMHYSVMSSVLHAFRHLYIEHSECQLFDVFAHLGNASEQAQLFLLKWIAEVEERMEWSRIIEETRRLQDWESRGKIISQCTHDFLPGAVLEEFMLAVSLIAVPRNALVHGPEISQLVLKDQKILIGKDHYLNAREMEHQLQWWGNVLRMRTKRIKGDLQKADDKMKECFSMLVRSLDAIWDVLADRFIDNLFGKPSLQEKYYLSINDS